MKAIRFLLICAAVTLSVAAACGMLPQVLYGKRIAGQVMDADTGQPVTGAHVAYVWESTIIPSGFTGHNSRTICYHAAATTTDAQGRFQIEAWRKWSTYDVYVLDPIALVYARNYTPRQILLHEGPAEPPIDRPNERYALKAFSGTTDERMNALFWGLANRGCRYGKDSQKSLYPMLKEIHAEARQIARTGEQQSTVQIIAELAADAALARNPNGPADDAQIDAFIEEHLK